MIRLVVDKSGILLAVEDDAKRGVVRGPISVRNFVRAVNEEFPELRITVHKGTKS